MATSISGTPAATSATQPSAMPWQPAGAASISLSGTTATASPTATSSSSTSRASNDAADLLVFKGQGGSYRGGASGNDTLAGGKGSDVLTGGADADTFRFGGDTKTDHITDFVSGEDRIELDNALFKALSDGGLTGAQFGLGTVATTAAQRLVYDSTSGNLWYDADGSGKAKAVLIGVLDNHATLTEADVLVV